MARDAQRPWLLALGLVAIASAGHAQRAAPEKTGPALNWTRQPGAESCIASVELAARVEARVKRPIFVAAPQAIVAVEGYVAPLPSGGFRAVIAMSDGQGVLYGSRELTTPGACSELDEGLVFVIAVTLRPQGGASGIELPENVATALDALFGAEPTEPDPAAYPVQPVLNHATPANAEPEPAPPTTATPTQAQAAPAVQAFVEAAGALQLGLQPDVGLGGGLALRVRVERIGSFSLGGALFAKTSQQIVDDDLERRADFTSRMVSLGYCTPALIRGAAFGLEACAAGRLGAITADADGFENDFVKDDLFASLGLAARLAFEASDNVVIALSAGPELHVARPVFVYERAPIMLGDASAGTADLLRVELFGAAAELSVAFALF